jgi:energy-coupling factor transporter ATP-binding protein EcfA2
VTAEDNEEAKPVSVFACSAFDAKYSIGKSLILDKGEGTIHPGPSLVPNQHDVYVVAGPSGAGKSTFCATYAGAYHYRYPKRSILYFSIKNEDPEIDALPFVTRVPPDQWVEYIGEPVQKKRKRSDDAEDVNAGPKYADIESYAKSLFIFDDYDMYPRAADLDRFRMYLICYGRSSEINVINVTHIISDFNKTRKELNEVTHVVIFPSKGIHKSVKSFLKGYLNLSDEDIASLLDRKIETYVNISIKMPITATTEKKIWMLDN